MFHAVKRWMYRGNRPNPIAGFFNQIWRAVASSGIMPDYVVTLEVIGRKSGRLISFPVVLALAEGERYIVSMLGSDAQWVQNVHAANGKAYIRAGKRREVTLKEVPVSQRAPLLKAYLQRAPGARPHIPVHKDAPLSDFEQVASAYPIFQIIFIKPA